MSSEEIPAERREVTVRRAPKYVPFLILGAVVGVVVAAVVAFAPAGDESFDRGAVFGFFLVTFGAGGAILGAVAALVLDRWGVRHQERAVVEAVPDSEPDDGTGQ
jgi:MFS family permease